MAIMKLGDALGGRYKLDQLIGKGGMGEVWAADDLLGGGRVAIKVVLPQIEEGQTREMRQRLLREASACARIQHANIIQVHEVGQTDEGDPYLVLELLEGQPLGDLLKQKRRLEPKLAARIAGDIASGLAEAHTAKVVHRDLKPANIFLHREPGMSEDEFVTKILDFGVCLDPESMDTARTKLGIAVGSPAYMSPEQVAAKGGIDSRADIWSLGVMLYEMVTGMRPFTGTVQNVMVQIALVPVPPPSSKVRDVPPDLDAVVARCTQIKKDLRYAEASELARDLYVIAGVKPVARSLSTSRPSALKQIGLAEMFDDEIHASPVVPSSDGPRAFNPAGRTLPLITRQNRPEVENLPPVMEEDADLAATMPMQSKILAAMRPKPSAEKPDAVTGTVFLPADAPIPSPEPAWKKEMEQRLEVHRQSSASIPALDLQTKLLEFEMETGQDVVGGTQLVRTDIPRKVPALAATRPEAGLLRAQAATLPEPGLSRPEFGGARQEMAETRPELPVRLDATGTTSTAGTMSQEIVLGPKSAPDPAVTTGGSRRKRRNQRRMYMALGGVAGVVMLLGSVLALRGVFAAKQATVQVVTDASSAAPKIWSPMSSDAVIPASVVAPPLEVPAPAPSAAAPVPETNPAPSVSAAPVETNPPAVSAAPTNTARPAVTNPTLSPTTVKTSAPVKTGGTTKKVQYKEVCTGVGVFQRCKKVPQ